ncbi:hypothetical protein VZT92_022903 [Zoarces viviparus]|uniref:Uncharacterized protein n=1 Tax=Zoarces viviparus TaxID=48416 RepID=A0AAW1E5P6_ZOAVI
MVSLIGEIEDQRQVTVLRDTGGSQAFILASGLPFRAESACDANTVVRGIDMGLVPAPLHRVYVETKLASGFFPVAVCSGFPVDGVEFIMGNDIAGGKVFPDPEVVTIPIPGSRVLFLYLRIKTLKVEKRPQLIQKWICH